MTRKTPIKALVFDAYGTVFDVHSVIALCNELFPGQGTQLSQSWRAKQLEYTWLKSLMGRYEDFGQITEAALKFACKSLKLDCPPESRKQLMQAYLHLEPFPEVKKHWLRYPTASSPFSPMVRPKCSKRWLTTTG